jgi:hypothetical protein
MKLVFLKNSSPVKLEFWGFPNPEKVPSENPWGGLNP